jgi:hypothetical protein
MLTVDTRHATLLFVSLKSVSSRPSIHRFVFSCALSSVGPGNGKHARAIANATQRFVGGRQAAEWTRAGACAPTHAALGHGVAWSGGARMSDVEARRRVLVRGAANLQAVVASAPKICQLDTVFSVGTTPTWARRSLITRSSHSAARERERGAEVRFWSLSEKACE